MFILYTLLTISQLALMDFITVLLAGRQNSHVKRWPDVSKVTTNDQFFMFSHFLLTNSSKHIRYYESTIPQLPKKLPNYFGASPHLPRRFFLILSFNVRLGLLGGVFHSVFPIKKPVPISLLSLTCHMTCLLQYAWVTTWKRPVRNNSHESTHYSVLSSIHLQPPS